MRRACIIRPGCALIAAAAGVIAVTPNLADAVSAKHGAWSGTAISNRGDQTTLKFTVTPSSVLKFTTGPKAPMYCYSAMMPGMEYPPLVYPYSVPRANKSGRGFWGTHTDRRVQYITVLNGTWRGSGRASGTFTLSDTLGYCHARYTFSAHFAHP
jgi:hypothetical protein